MSCTRSTSRPRRWSARPSPGRRDEALSLASGIGSDDPYEALALPEPEPEDPPGEQEPADGLRGWFEDMGWEWPW